MAAYLDDLLQPQERIAFQARIGLWQAALRMLPTFAVAGAAMWALDRYVLEFEPSPELAPFALPLKLGLSAVPLLCVFAFFVLSAWRSEVLVSDRRLMIRCGALRKKVWETPLADIERFDTVAGNLAIRVAGVGPVLVGALPGRNGPVAAIAAQTGLQVPSSRSRRVKIWDRVAALVSVGSGISTALLLTQLLEPALPTTAPYRAESVIGLLLQLAGALATIQGLGLVVVLGFMSALIIGMAAGLVLIVPAVRLSLDRDEARVFFQSWTVTEDAHRWVKVFALVLTWTGRRLASLLYGERF